MHRLQLPCSDSVRLALASELKRSHELRLMHRLHAVLLVSLGRSCYEVARWFSQDPRSVERWIHAFADSGTAGLRDHGRCGRPALLSSLQRLQLALELDAAPTACGYAPAVWSGKLLARHLESRYGISLSLRGCQRLLQSQASTGCRSARVRAASGDAARLQALVATPETDAKLVDKSV